MTTLPTPSFAPRIAGRLAAVVALALTPSAALAQLIVDAGDDVVLECEADGVAEYTLNGSATGGDGIEVSWDTVPPVPLDDADTLTPTGLFPLGTTVATLSGFADDGGSDSDSVAITVEDTAPPVVRLEAEPKILWPPNHEMRRVDVRVRARDRCADDRDLRVVLLRVTSDEPDNGTGDGNTINDIQGASLGQDDRTVLLRAERKGNGDGRTYTLTYRVIDPSGNETEAQARVYVPHDASEIGDRYDDDDDGDLDRYEPICPRPRDAADAFEDTFPDLSHFASERDCQKACKVWAKGCQGVVKGAAICYASEQKSLMAIEALMCPTDRDRKRHCMAGLKDEARRDKDGIRQEASEAAAACADRGLRCYDACATLHADDWYEDD